MTGYKVVVDVPVRFSDTDAMGHTNNARYLSYLEEARFAYMKRLFDVRDWKKIGIILARVEIDYRSPSFCGELLAVGIRVSKLGGASFEAAYTIEDKATGRLVAEAKTVQVWYDYAASKVSRIPADAAKRLREFEGLA